MLKFGENAASGKISGQGGSSSTCHVSFPLEPQSWEDYKAQHLDLGDLMRLGNAAQHIFYDFDKSFMKMLLHYNFS
jgi:hypothetical protein